MLVAFEASIAKALKKKYSLMVAKIDFELGFLEMRVNLNSSNFLAPTYMSFESFTAK